MRIAQSLMIAAVIGLIGAVSVSAKPVSDQIETDPSDQSARQLFRANAIETCVDGNPQPGGVSLSGDRLRDVCTCAIDRYMEGRPNEVLLPIIADRMTSIAWDELRQCAGEAVPGARRVPEDPPSSAPSGVDGLLAWLDGFGLPRWSWLPIALILLFLLRKLFRRDGSNDLMAPPRSMRPGSRPPSPPPPPAM